MSPLIVLKTLRNEILFKGTDISINFACISSQVRYTFQHPTIFENNLNFWGSEPLIDNCNFWNKQSKKKPDF